RMRAPAEMRPFAQRLQAPDQAGNLAGAYIECGDDRRTPRMQRAHAGSETARECGVHESAPLGFTVSFFKVAAASSDKPTVTRSGTRRSIDVRSRVMICRLRSS